MVLWTLEKAAKATCFDDLICATDDKRIAEVVQSAGFTAIITPGNFLTGSDRVAYVADQLESDLILNLQGDEPCADPELLKEMMEVLEQNPEHWVTSACPISPEFLNQPSVVKVWLDEEAHALTFDRSHQIIAGATCYKHTGVYAYSKEKLMEFAQYPRSSQEIELSLEQLRVFPKQQFKVVVHQEESHSVDIPEDIKVVEKLLEEKIVHG